MEASAIGSSAATAPQAQSREPVRQPPAEREARQAAEAGRAEQRQDSPPPADKPRPVVNAQGQTTGTIINTAA